jgi:hypothetical protein
MLQRRAAAPKNSAVHPFRRRIPRKNFSAKDQRCRESLVTDSAFFDRFRPSDVLGHGSLCKIFFALQTGASRTRLLVFQSYRARIFYARLRIFVITRACK